MDIRQRHSFLLLLVAMALYVVILTYLTWLRYEVLDASTFDMGINVQISNTILTTGLPLQTPNWVTSNGAISNNFFGVHFSPIRYFFAGIYYLHPDPITLLFIQALFIALGALPIFKISQHFFHNDRTPIIISLLYLMFPPIIMSNLYDFHALSVLPFAVLSGYYCYLTRQYRKAIIFFLFAALIQEAALALLFAVGLQLLVLNWKDAKAFITNRSFVLKNGILFALIVASPVAFVFENLLIGRFNTTAGFIVTSPTAYGLALFNLIQNVPQKTEYWLIMLAFVGFIPLLRPTASILVLPYLIVSLFGSNPTFSQFYWQYNFLVAPGIFLGLIYGLDSLLKNRALLGGFLRVRYPVVFRVRYIPILLLAISTVFTPLFPFAASYLPANPHIVQYYLPPSNSAGLEKIFSLIPTGTSVLASDNIFAHVAKSINVYPIIYGHNSSSSYLQTQLPANISLNYIVIVASDYYSASLLVRDFPTSYGLKGEATIEYQQFSAFAPVQQEKTTVFLYSFQYQGPITIFGQ
jgi:uncharacterized membrane protein